MFLSRLNLFTDRNLYHPEDVIDTTPITKDGILDILNDDSKAGDIIPLDEKDLEDDKDDKIKKKEEKKEDKKEEDEDEDDNKELRELEEDLKEPTEEDLELVTPVRRREILAKYPNVFKDFPYLEKAYYREQQFTEVFSTIQDAKEASDSLKILHNFEADISQGNTEKLLSGLKEANPKGFNKLVDSYLPTLLKTDKDAYTHVVGNLTKNTVRGMIQTARADNNEALEIAANLLYKWAFNSSKWEEPSNLSSDKDDVVDKSKDEIQTEREKFLSEKLESAQTDLSERFNNSLKSTIDSYIDPRDSMSPYVKKHATNECLSTLNDLISKDTRFTSLIDKLWEKALESNLNKDSLETITKAFKSKARTLLPAVLKQARKEALKGSSVKTKDNDDTDDNDNDSKDNVKKRSENRDTRPPKLKSGQADGPKENESTADYFMRD